ncbi:phosphatidylinositol 3-kinase regulatory subunit alpha isoform X4, partial [Paramuricea clavata]
ANEKLADCRDGSFLVRDSRREDGYTLMLRKDDSSKQIRIEHSNGKYGFTEPCDFNSVPELIEYYRTRSLKEYSAALDIMLLYPVCRETEVSEVKRAANILKKAGELFNEKSSRYEELSDNCFECEQEIAALEEAISAQKELINFLEEQVKIHINFRKEAPTTERASLDVNYNLLVDRLSEQQSGLKTLEQDCLEKSEKRREIESEMNRLKPDLWELQHKKDKYMLFLEEKEMRREEVELLAGNTDFKIYEFPMTEEEEKVNLSPEYWLFGALDRDTVKSYLDKSLDGTFLIRESKNRGMKAVSIM